MSPSVEPQTLPDGLDVGEVGRGGAHGGAGGPHVVEEEDRHGGEAEHAEPGHAQNKPSASRMIPYRKKNEAMP
ncbi:hypothetical protein EYF80_037906 [Liparis tanakae]|uniref:Uncharacterized protein n=1 Tax=Liparis tanakae TaxID=230148 RepID=A0A4Z2GF19_9TELE|nr:hypothetical protein EYF80_037906 [Liparis tanakae]